MTPAKGSGIGAKFVGGNPAVARDRSGLYATPPEATLALCKRWERRLRGATIWEPCAGNGAMSVVLHTALGAKVLSSDIAPAAPGIKQLDVFATNRLPHVDAIITNPPFPLAARLIQHIHNLTPQNVMASSTNGFFALLLKATYWHSAKRQGLFESWRPSHIHPLTWRLDFNGAGSPVMEMMWCVWADVRPAAAVSITKYDPISRP